MSGSLTIESGIDVLYGEQDGVALEGVSINLTGEFIKAADGNPSRLDVSVEGEVELHAKMKVMELKDLGFAFDMSWDNMPGTFNPTFDYQLNSISVGEVIIEFDDLMVLKSTETNTFNFNDPDNPGMVPDPIAVLGKLAVEFPSDPDAGGDRPLAGMTGEITNLEIGADLLPKLSKIEGVALGIPDILADSLEWLPVGIDQLAVEFHNGFFIEEDGLIRIDVPNAFSVIGSGGVTPVKYEDKTVFSLTGEVEGLELDVDQRERRV